MQNDSITKTIVVVVTLCAVCSLIVSVAAVKLRPLQKANAAEEIARDILEISGLQSQGDIALKLIEPRIVDLKSGNFDTHLSPDRFDMLRAAQDPATSRALSSEEDIASIDRLPKYAKVYLVRNDKDLTRVERIIFPIYGYGLWSILHGFITLESDGNTIYRLKFYQHKETPGLGARVDSVAWRQQWEGKRIYNRAGQVALGIGKCRTPLPTDSKYKIDGLSGATLTACGVNNMIDFWFGDKGYGPFLKSRSFDTGVGRGAKVSARDLKDVATTGEK